MSQKIRVIGLGQPLGGDDAVGIAVVEQVHQQVLPTGVDIIEKADPTELPELLADVETVVLVDAVLVQGQPGNVLILKPEAFEDSGYQPFSTHGVGVLESIELARNLSGAAFTSNLVIIGITINLPHIPNFTLSPPVNAAIPKAVKTILEIIHSPHQFFTRLK